MGCGVKFCGDKLDWYIVCEYYPPGNVEVNGVKDKDELFRTNVQKQVEGKESDTAVEAESGGATATQSAVPTPSKKSEGNGVYAR